jgi:hypothetical protein
MKRTGSSFLMALAMALAAVGGFVSVAGAQEPAAAGAGIATAVLLILGLLVIVGVAVKLYDFKRRRDGEAVHIQAQVSDALLREERLLGVPVTATAHIATWKGTPVILELTGEVPSPELREAALGVATAEARRVRPDVEIRDRMSLAAPARAA